MEDYQTVRETLVSTKAAHDNLLEKLRDLNKELDIRNEKLSVYESGVSLTGEANLSREQVLEREVADLK
jgi:hypothetical protein